MLANLAVNVAIKSLQTQREKEAGYMGNDETGRERLGSRYQKSRGVKTQNPDVEK